MTSVWILREAKNNELIFVAGAYYDWMEKDAVQKIFDFEKCSNPLH
jgi:hypothetical protein